MKAARPALSTRPRTRPAALSPRPVLGSFTSSSAASTAARSGMAGSLMALWLALPKKGSHIRRVAPVYKHQPGAPGVPIEQAARRLMPWNDNANPGPWGSPPPEDERRDKPERRQGGGPRGPQRPNSGG